MDKSKSDDQEETVNSAPDEIEPEIDEEDDKNRMIDFLKKYNIKITAEGLKEEIKDLREKIEGQEKIMNFVKEVNE